MKLSLTTTPSVAKLNRYAVIHSVLKVRVQSLRIITELNSQEKKKQKKTTQSRNKEHFNKIKHNPNREKDS